MISLKCYYCEDNNCSTKNQKILIDCNYWTATQIGKIFQNYYKNFDIIWSNNYKCINFQGFFKTNNNGIYQNSIVIKIIQGCIFYYNNNSNITNYCNYTFKDDWITVYPNYIISCKICNENECNKQISLSSSHIQISIIITLTIYLIFL